MNTESLTLSYRQVAHDVRPVVAAMNVLTQKLKGELSEESYELSLLILNRLMSLSTGLLEATNRTKSSGANVREVIERIIREKAVLYGNRVRFSGNFLALDRSTEIKMPTQDLERVLSNLIDNAIEAMNGDERPIVKIWIEKSDSGIEIKIIDFGCGMSPEQLEKVRNNDFKSQKQGGLGVGLQSVFRIVKANHAEIHFDSKLGLGSIATVAISR